jgi:hypothetical protein
VRRDGEHVACAESRGEQRLVRIAKRGVREQHGLLLEHPLRELSRPELLEPLAGPGRRLAGWQPRRTWLFGARRRGPAFHLRVSVDDHLADEAQQPRGAVALARVTEQFRRLVDEPRRVLRALETRMHDHLIQESQVGHHAPDAKLPQRAVHPRDRLLGTGAQAVTFTSSESYERVMNAPVYAVPASRRIRTRPGSDRP